MIKQSAKLRVIVNGTTFYTLAHLVMECDYPIRACYERVRDSKTQLGAMGRFEYKGRSFDVQINVIN